MNVLLPRVNKDGFIAQWRPMKDSDHLIPQFQRGYANDMFWLVNKQPVWLPDKNIYCLKFDKRKAMPSVKNFQLINSLNRILLYIKA